MTEPNQEVFAHVLRQYDLTPETFSIERIGSGYIHQTFLLSGETKLVLQRVNKNVFREPEVIASNLRLASAHIAARYPDYLFLTALPTTDGKEMAYGPDGFPWRIFPFFDNTFTIDRVENADQAFSAAAEFGRLSLYLRDADVAAFGETIPRFHDLDLRFRQFRQSLETRLGERKKEAADAIDAALKYEFLVHRYNDLIASGVLKLRITHNDTKINNVLFDSQTGKAVTAIDLDTLMPGYFIYDVGDMIRTFVSPVDEEERDLARIVVRPDIYSAVIRGYLSQMGGELTAAESKEIHFGGMMMTYIMALRMLADYLNGDVYYNIRYEGQNLYRARNQFRLLDLLNAYTDR